MAQRNRSLKADVDKLGQLKEQIEELREEHTKLAEKIMARTADGETIKGAFYKATAVPARVEWRIDGDKIKEEFPESWMERFAKMVEKGRFLRLTAYKTNQQNQKAA